MNSIHFKTTTPTLVYIRLGLYGLTVCFGLAIVGITSYLEYIQNWEPLAVYLLPFAIGLFTLFVIAPMVILDRFRRDAAFHQPRVELIWAGTVMLAWLAGAVFFTLKMLRFPSCTLYKGLYFGWNYESEYTWCGLHLTVKWGLWGGFAMLMGLLLGIITYGMLNDRKSRGHVWTTAIPDFESRPPEGPEARLMRERLERQADIDTTLGGLQRYNTQRRMEPSQPSLNDRPRPPSPALSSRSGPHGAPHYVLRRTAADQASTTNLGGHTQQSSHSAISLRPMLPIATTDPDASVSQPLPAKT